MKTGKRGRKWGREGKVRKGGGREGKVFAKPLRWAKSFGGNSPCSLSLAQSVFAG